MLLWAGVFLILLGCACFPIDRWAAHTLYDHESEAFERFLEATTHWAKAAHWLVAAFLAYGIAILVLTFIGPVEEAREAVDYTRAFVASLLLGSAILHGMKLVLGRRRPRDDMEMGLYEFVWFKFKTDYNSFPSGHALTIMCVAVIATSVAPKLAVVWFAIALWLGVTRALLTAHFFSDVFIGAGIGLVAARETLLYLFPALFRPWF
ncbi:MAG: phosphatase PAP2 family protein [Alphaproteobacteria bacterium]|nr:phosphatase PAP2 family protein [Alphaproteobacteria bacterium]MBV9419355.1 phosphatase PAP2 family protein [Alphaproteobacteria bacterium]